MKGLCKDCVKMNNYLGKLSQIVLYGHFLIAFASMGQSLITYYILGFPFQLVVVALEGSATFLMYNLALYLSLPRNGISPYKRTNWVLNNAKLLVVLNLFAFFIFAISFLKANEMTKLYFLFMSFLSLLYILPILKRQEKRVGLRQVPGLKVFHITFIWVLSCVGLPFIDLYAEGVITSSKEVWGIFFMRGLFYFACILPFDIRDMKQDQSYELKTIPHLIGRKKSIALCYGVLILHSFLIIFTSYPLFIKLSCWLTNLFILILFRTRIFNPKARYEDAYLLDLMLFTQFGIAFIFWVFE